MKYELYHDESQENGFWHGYLLVPQSKKEELGDHLRKARENSLYEYPISIKQVKRMGKIFNCAYSWVQIGVASLISDHKGQKYPVDYGKKILGRKQLDFFSSTIGAKFILFREKDCHSKMKFHSDHGSKIETTFRMGLKGGLHYLGSNENSIIIDKMHFDGHEHYRRNIDKNRIVGRLQGLRNYCFISDRQDLIDDRHSKHNKDGSQSYLDCQLVQLVDLMVGCFRSRLEKRTQDVHGRLSLPISEVLKRYFQGYARMEKSRWKNSLCLSQCFLENNQWNYETFYPNKKEIQKQIMFPL